MSTEWLKVDEEEEKRDLTDSYATKGSVGHKNERKVKYVLDYLCIESFYLFYC